MDESIPAATGQHQQAAAPAQTKTTTTTTTATSNTAHASSGGGKSLPITDCISVDITHQYIDIPHQDSGSNQSGSDSGLGGYTNSLSSDNSSSNNVIAFTASAAAAVQDQAKYNTTNCSNAYNNNSIINNNSNGNNNNNIVTENQSLSRIDLACNAINKSLIGAKPTNQSCLSSNQSLLIANGNANNNNESKTNIHNNCEILVDADGSRALSDKCTKLTISPNAQATLLKHEPKQSSNESLLSRKHNSTSCETQVHQVPPSPKHADPARAPSKMSPSSGTDNRVPILKSLLKKPSRFHVDDASRVKHKRSVSFNQTVIVFCEEIRTYPPDDQFELPIDYQDSSCRELDYEPPDEYCDHTTDANDGNSNHHRDEVDGSLFHGVSNGRVKTGFDASNLTDDQLIGFLENESLLNAFKLDSDDLSEEDFPINQMINHSNVNHVRDDAISDYDSDSESSLFVDTQAQVKKTAPVSFDRNVNTSGSGSNKSSNRDEKLDSSASNLEAGSKSKSSGSSDNGPKVSIAPAQKSMPARMKVSTLDNSQSKKQADKSEVNDLKKVQHKLDEKKSLNDGKVTYHSANEAVTTKNLQQTTNNKLLSQTTTSSRQAAQLASNPINTSGSNQRETKSVYQSKFNEQVSSTESEFRASSQAIRNVEQSSSCQMCRFAELTKSSPGYQQAADNQRPDNLALNSHNNVTNKQLAGDMPSSQMSQSSATMAPNQSSCVSCQEANHIFTGNRAHGLARPPQLGQSNQQPIRPIAYQIVYVVDAQGNRVRALSLVRPPQGFPGVAPSTNRPPIMNGTLNQGLRFPNPVALSDGKLVSTGPNLYQQIGGNLNQNSAANNISVARLNEMQQQHYRVLTPGQSGQSIQLVRSDVHHPQVSQIGITSNPSYVATANGVAGIQRSIPVESLRHHTVYYLRQPLDSQNISRQTTGKNLNQVQARSFPDPHEVRRLDGLMAPAASVDKLYAQQLQGSVMSSKPNQDGSVFSRSFASDQRGLSKDDADDPSFGFSKRPSVKVVSSAQNHQNKNTIYRGYDGNHIQNSSAALLDTSRLHMSSLATKSQTLDRRQQVNNPQSQLYKETIPSSNSMSNINSKYMTDGANVVNHNPSASTSANQNISQQPRISEQKSSTLSKINNDSSQTKLKGNEIVHLIAAQSRQNSSLGTIVNSNNDSGSQNSRYQRAQDQSEVAYSMNI